MIHDNVKNIGRYEGLGWLRRALETAGEYSAPDCEIGAHAICDGLRAVVNRYEPQGYEEGKFENHRQYVDVQYLAAGTEKIGVIAAEGGELVRGYDPGADYEMFAAREGTEVCWLEMEPGDFAVLFPGEAHYPGVKRGEGGVRKIVFKVRTDLIGSGE